MSTQVKPSSWQQDALYCSKSEVGPQRTAHLNKLRSQSGSFSGNALEGKDTGDGKITALFMTEDVKPSTKCQGKPFRVHFEKSWYL